MKTARDSSQHALIHFIARCCRAENWAALSHLGISANQARRIGGLSAYESDVLVGLIERVAVLQLRFANLKDCLREIQAGGPEEGDSGECPEMELCMHLCCRIANLYRNNERRELRRIGLRPDQARLVCSLSSFEVQGLARHFWRFAMFKMDAGKMEQAVEVAVGTARWLQQCAEMVRAGAPQGLMLHYYGINNKAYAKMRRMHGMQLRGRPRVLPDDMQGLLYIEFVSRYRSGEAGTDLLRQPGFFLSLYDSMGRKVPLREIWTLVQGWLASNEGRGPSDQDTR